MEKAQKSVDSIVDSVKKATISEKKQKVKKKEKGGDGGADGASHITSSFDVRALILTHVSGCFGVKPTASIPLRTSEAVRAIEGEVRR
jgi:hypothetical protein